MKTDTEMLEELIGKVDFLQISCNVLTLNGVKQIATFKLAGGAICSVEGWTITDCLLKVEHVVELTTKPASFAPEW